MPLDFAMSLMSAVEFVLWAALGIPLLDEGLASPLPCNEFLPGFACCLHARAAWLLYLQAQPWGHGYFPFYFYRVLGVFIASAVTLFFVTLEIFGQCCRRFRDYETWYGCLPLGCPGFSHREPGYPSLTRTSV